MRKQEGITLMTLVITIIILLILAGVVLNLAISENGIIKLAEKAGKTQTIAEIKDDIKLKLLEAESQAILRGEKIEEEQIKDIVAKYGEIQEDGNIKLKDSEEIINFKELYNREIVANGSYTDKKEKITKLENQVKELEKQIEKLESTSKYEIIDLGQITSYDVKYNYPSNYKELTTENFVLKILEISGNPAGYWENVTLGVTSIGISSFTSGEILYDSELGKLNIIPPSGKIFLSSATGAIGLNENLNIKYKILLIK